MSVYQHILLAVDFSDHADEVAEVAKKIAEQNQAQLSIIYVFENIPFTDNTYAPISYDADVFQELLNVAKERLRTFASERAIPLERQWLELGSPRLEIVRIAEENAVDLIVLGSHGRHGLALILGSTANGVLHHAKCDVLAVRLKAD